MGLPYRQGQQDRQAALGRKVLPDHRRTRGNWADGSYWCHWQYLVLPGLQGQLEKPDRQAQQELSDQLARQDRKVFLGRRGYWRNRTNRSYRGYRSHVPTGSTERQELEGRWHLTGPAGVTGATGPVGPTVTTLSPDQLARPAKFQTMLFASFMPINPSLSSVLPLRYFPDVTDRKEL